MTLIPLSERQLGSSQTRVEEAAVTGRDARAGVRSVTSVITPGASRLLAQGARVMSNEVAEDGGKPALDCAAPSN